MRHAVWVLALVVLAVRETDAQEAGQPQAGRVLAQQICADCHAVMRGQVRSPNTAAPTFETIAAVPRMNATALAVALRSSHRTMPNIMLEPDELANVAAYIMSLKPGG